MRFHLWQIKKLFDKNNQHYAAFPGSAAGLQQSWTRRRSGALRFLFVAESDGAMRGSGPEVEQFRNESL
jgi:hypothetical protein